MKQKISTTFAFKWRRQQLAFTASVLAIVAGHSGRLASAAAAARVPCPLRF